jgi:hypothetical protein
MSEYLVHSTDPVIDVCSTEPDTDVALVHHLLITATAVS